MDLFLTGSLYYLVTAIKPGEPCDPTIGSKTLSGPYSQSLSNITEIIIVGTNNVQEPTFELSIYPNPFNDKTIIEFSNPDNTCFQLIITDITGKVIKFIENIHTNKVEVERGKLSSGFYIIELRGERIYRDRIIIE